MQNFKCFQKSKFLIFLALERAYGRKICKKYLNWHLKAFQHYLKISVHLFLFSDDKYDTWVPPVLVWSPKIVSVLLFQVPKPNRMKKCWHIREVPSKSPLSSKSPSLFFRAAEKFVRFFFYRKFEWLPNHFPFSFCKNPRKGGGWFGRNFPDADGEGKRVWRMKPILTMMLITGKVGRETKFHADVIQLHPLR